MPNVGIGVTVRKRPIWVKFSSKCNTIRKSPSGSSMPLLSPKYLADPRVEDPRLTPRLVTGGFIDLASPHHEVATDVKQTPIRPIVKQQHRNLDWTCFNLSPRTCSMANLQSDLIAGFEKQTSWSSLQSLSHESIYGTYHSLASCL